MERKLKHMAKAERQADTSSCAPLVSSPHMAILQLRATAATAFIDSWLSGGTQGVRFICSTLLSWTEEVECDFDLESRIIGSSRKCQRALRLPRAAEQSKL